MKIKELKELLANAGDNDNIEVVNNKIVFIKDKPKDITERIKTFEDACEWCRENGKKEMTEVYGFIHNNLSNMEGEIDKEDKDIIAYLKLRIIITALNEGWKPEFFEYEERYSVIYPFTFEKNVGDYNCEMLWVVSSHKMVLKSEELAKYAAKQFHDIYCDFYSCKEGGEK